MVYLGLPIKNGGSVHGELLNNQMVFIFCRKVPISPEENSSHFSLKFTYSSSNICIRSSWLHIA